MLSYRKTRCPLGGIWLTVVRELPRTSAALVGGRRKQTHLIEIYGGVRINLRAGPVVRCDARVGTVDAKYDIRDKAHVGVRA